ncbi:hypothetical protein BJ978_000786 [Agromyces terreus]|uniref:Uncharacterized protein n=1 Tax=Agromyces terreus TaxID=424795 RepID=A0A9X2GW24_9MICO|nr:hypothetical protein [Agromyces terreus]
MLKVESIVRALSRIVSPQFRTAHDDVGTVDEDPLE